MGYVPEDASSCSVCRAQKPTTGYTGYACLTLNNHDTALPPIHETMVRDTAPIS